MTETRFYDPNDPHCPHDKLQAKTGHWHLITFLKKNGNRVAFWAHCHYLDVNQ